VDLSVIDGALACPDADGQRECATAFERQLISAKADFLMRKIGRLIIRLKSGRYRTLPNEKSDLHVVEVTGEFAIIIELFWEGSTWHILNLNSGVFTKTKGYPLFSPNGQFVVCFHQDLEAGYSANIFDVYQIGDGALIKLFSANPDKEGWGPGSVSWLNSDRILFNKVRWNPAPSKRFEPSEYYFKEPFILKLNHGKWEMMPRTSPSL